MNRSEQTEGGRRIAQERPVRHLLVAVPIVVCLVVLTAFVAAGAGAFPWLVRDVLAIYFPAFLVNGTPNRELVGFAVFLILTAFFVYRRKYWIALATLTLPVATTWILAWTLMGD